MYGDISLWLSLLFMVGGLAVLAWSSDLFVAGASALAKAVGVSPFIIGMVVIGFGTSAPELCVSALSGLAGHANLSLGNAYGSCIFNITIVLGVAAMILPLKVKPAIAAVASPALALIALLSLGLFADGECTRGEALLLLAVFAVLLPLYCWFDQKTSGGAAAETEQGVKREPLALSLVKVVAGLALLVGSSHLLVWGSVDFAKFLGVGDLVIGLTVVAAGTSLPELASAIAAARRGEPELVLGNVIGSNFFNTLAVVGIATAISPITHASGGFSPYVLTRDLPLMTVLSLSLAFLGVNWRRVREPGHLGRRTAAIWMVVYALYTLLMFYQEVHQ